MHFLLEESISTETSQVLTVFNKAIHHEDDSSDDKSVIEIESPKENGEQEIGKQDKLLTTTFQIEIEITENDAKSLSRLLAWLL